jgi:hypothetical protein
MSPRGRGSPKPRRDRNQIVIPAAFFTAEVIRIAIAFWRDHRDGIRMERQLRVRQVEGVRGLETVVELDDRVPPKDPRWQITTSRNFLPRARFMPNARAKVRDAAERRVGNHPDGELKGRALYCVDLHTQEVVAALSYHIPKNRREPLLVTAVALRSEPELAQESQACARITKRYVHALARKLRRRTYVDFTAEAGSMSVDLAILNFVKDATESHDGEVRFRQADE